jgi:DUF3047 family protein
VVAVSAATVLVSNPAHRAFYLGAPPVRVRDAAPPSAFARPDASVVAAAVHSAERAQIEVRVAAMAAGATGAPAGWSIREFTGHADVAVVKADGRVALRLRTNRSSFALYHDVLVDLADAPLFTWSWKVLRLPAGGDVRQPGRDDQAAQVYVVFPRWPSPMTRSDVLGYVWDTAAPVGTRVVNPRAPNVRVLVVESGPAQVGTWQRYQRNVAADYAAMFGRQPPRVGHVAVMSDSDDTRTETEALIASLAFARGP